MKGVFILQTADDLYGKVRHDYGRVRQNRADAYAAFDFVVTAWHLLEWRYGNGRRREEIADRFPFHRVCEHLANGAKHFHPPRNAAGKPVQGSELRSMWAPGFWAKGFWAPGLWDYLVVRLDGAPRDAYGEELGIVQLADLVMEFWKGEGGFTE